MFASVVDCDESVELITEKKTWTVIEGDYDYRIPSYPGEVNIVGGTLVSAEWVSLLGEL